MGLMMSHRYNLCRALPWFAVQKLLGPESQLPNLLSALGDYCVEYGYPSHG